MEDKFIKPAFLYLSIYIAFTPKALTVLYSAENTKRWMNEQQNTT